MTVVNAWVREIVVLEELEAVNVVRLWLPRNALPSGLGTFLKILLTIGDSFNPVVPKSGFTLVKLRRIAKIVHRTGKA